MHRWGTMFQWGRLRVAGNEQQRHNVGGASGCAPPRIITYGGPPVSAHGDRSSCVALNLRLPLEEADDSNRPRAMRRAVQQGRDGYRWPGSRLPRACSAAPRGVRLVSDKVHDSERAAGLPIGGDGPAGNRVCVLNSGRWHRHLWVCANRDREAVALTQGRK